MIRFSCYCGHRFVLEDSAAAGTVQCPDCRKLNDVPTHQDLANLDEQGVIQLKPIEITEEPDRLAALSQIYTKSRQDESGRDIDFRPTAEELARRGEPTVREPEKVIRPRYDPETGQLIRPIDITPLSPRKAIPVKPAALYYARRDTPQTVVLSATELARPINIFIMLWALLFMLLAGLLEVLVFMPNFHFLFFIAPMAFFEVLAIAHYGATMEELGPRAGDGLPRMFGNVEFYEDIWAPFWALTLSVLICYGPAIVCFHLPVPALGLVVGLLATGAGTYLFPAVALTLATSGTLSNLRPDRLIGTISACGPSYIWPILSWMLAGGIYFWAFLYFLTPLMGHGSPYIEMLPNVMTMLFAVPVLHILTVPFAHVFAWQTGMLYRQHYDAFPWVGQRHEKQIALAKKV